MITRIMNVSAMSVTSKFVTYWVITGAASGAIISGSRKLYSIMNEDNPNYTNDIEPAIRCVYHTSRIAGHAGMGAAIAGIVALTAPISIPAYCWWKA